jgi:hypothetical protein
MMRNSNLLMVWDVVSGSVSGALGRRRGRGTAVSVTVTLVSSSCAVGTRYGKYQVVNTQFALVWVVIVVIPCTGERSAWFEAFSLDWMSRKHGVIGELVFFIVWVVRARSSKETIRTSHSAGYSVGAMLRRVRSSGLIRSNGGWGNTTRVRRDASGLDRGSISITGISIM